LEYHFFPAEYSIQSPTSTTRPPTEAANGHPHDNDDSEDDAKAKIIFKWTVCGSIVVLIGLALILDLIQRDRK
jgi:hypothetical protein